MIESNKHYNHKGKIENISTSNDIPFAFGSSFSLQPSKRIWFANSNS